MDKRPADGEDGENGENTNPKQDATFTGTFDLIRNAHNKLRTQNIKTPAAVKIRDEVCAELIYAMDAIEELRTVFGDNATAALKALTEQIKLNTSCLPAIEQEIREIKADTKEIKDSKNSPPAKTWAQQVATKHPPSTRTKETADAKRRERLRKHEPYEVTLIAPDEKTKKTISNMHGTKITQRCQSIINAELENKPKLNGITKTSNGVRLNCETPEDANLIRTLNFATFDGLQLHTKNYGVVIYGVPTDIVTTLENEDTKASTLKEWGEANRDIKITRVKPLRRKLRANRPTHPAHQSIVVFTDDAHAADRCLKLGFDINSEYYDTVKYAPQQHITQCYNCHGFGHIAARCKNTTPTCGKCSKHHKTTECQNTEHTCCHCKGSHPAWSTQCPVRKIEAGKLNALGVETSLYFSPDFE
jgi:hypothetical protein